MKAQKPTPIKFEAKVKPTPEAKPEAPPKATPKAVEKPVEKKVAPKVEPKKEAPAKAEKPVEKKAEPEAKTKEEQAEKTAAKEFKRVANVGYSADKADLSVNDTTKIGVIKQFTGKLKEGAGAARTYFSKTPRMVDGLRNMAFDLVEKTPRFRRTAGESKAEANFFAGMAKVNAREFYEVEDPQDRKAPKVQF